MGRIALLDGGSEHAYSCGVDLFDGLADAIEPHVDLFLLGQIACRLQRTDVETDAFIASDAAAKGDDVGLGDAADSRVDDVDADLVSSILSSWSRSAPDRTVDIRLDDEVQGP